MSNVQHTPTPWCKVFNGLYHEIRTGVTEDAGFQIGDTCASKFTEGGDVGFANAEHIVHCVNSHDALVQALQQYRSNYAMTKDELDMQGYEPWRAIQDAADAALRDAGEEVPRD